MKDDIAIAKYRKAIDKVLASKDSAEQRRLLKRMAETLTKLATKKPRWRPFREARKLARSLGLTRHVEWAQWSRSGDRPKDIPASPWTVYSDWVDMKDWLGDSFSRKEYSTQKWRPFKQAREFVRGLGLKTEREWRLYCKNPGEREAKPDDIPVYPAQAYRKDYQGMKDWLGYNPKDRHRSFKKAREFVMTLGIRTVDEWRLYCSSGKLPDDIPSNPQRVYRGLGWVDWWDWLGKEKKGWSRQRRVKHIDAEQKSRTKFGLDSFYGNR
jgi:hypothetical protein